MQFGMIHSIIMGCQYCAHSIGPTAKHVFVKRCSAMLTFLCYHPLNSPKLNCFGTIWYVGCTNFIRLQRPPPNARDTLGAVAHLFVPPFVLCPSHELGTPGCNTGRKADNRDIPLGADQCTFDLRLRRAKLPTGWGFYELL